MITETCIDGAPHNCIPKPGNTTEVFCQKCLKTFYLSTNPDPPPSDSVIFNVSGGDDTAALQDALNSLPEGKTLAISGMAKIYSTIKLENIKNKILAGFDATSGILVCSDSMWGPYNSMLWLNNTDNFVLRDFEINVQGKTIQPIEIDGGNDNSVERLYIHDIGHADNKGLSAIHLEHGFRPHIVGNRIERTGGKTDVDAGIRGIWLGKGVNDSLVEDNNVSDTGHTCIAVEPSGIGIVRRNTARNSLTQGTLYKFSYHPELTSTGKVEFYENLGENSKNGGLMLEGMNFPEIDIHNNHFVNCGSQGSTFGALYSSQNTNKNVHFHDNIIENCRSQGALNSAEACRLENNQIIGESTLWLENNCRDITLLHSGKANVGNNVSNVWVDGKKIA